MSAAEKSPLSALIGESPAMQRAKALLERAARSDATVLLEGETGVGKDVAARALHRASGRRAGPFVVFDCGAVAPQLLSSELFGHVEGAFTGATADRAGIFESAEGGTVFLDEIGELSAELQPALLRALESRRVRRVGEATERPVDVRVVAATNRDLAAEVEAGRFRRDLLYRLAIVRVRLPPLRERPEDIPALAARFLVEAGRDRGALLSADLARLQAAPWPGNVRELKNVVEQAAALSGATLRMPGLDEAAPAARREEGGPLEEDALYQLPWKQAKERLVHRFERRYLEALLEASEGNVSAAARAAGVARGHLHRQLSRHGLKGGKGPR